MVVVRLPAAAGLGPGAVRRVRWALEDDEVRSLELGHELLGQQAGRHFPGGAAARLAALVEAQSVGQRRGELGLVDGQ